MAKVTYEDPIHHLSGKISKKFRTTYCFRNSSNRKYTQVHSERTGAPSDGELDSRERFTRAAAAARNAMRDSTKLQTHIAAFKQQKRYTTLFGFIFAQLYNE